MLLIDSELPSDRGFRFFVIDSGYKKVRNISLVVIVHSAVKSLGKNTFGHLNGRILVSLICHFKG